MPESSGSIETQVALLRQRVNDLYEVIHGGPGTKREDSLRGRVHELMQRASNEDKLLEAVREMRRASAETRKQVEWRFTLAVAVAAALPAWVALLITYWP